MIQIKAGKRQIVASALTFCFFLQQSFCMQVMASYIPGASVVQDGNTFNIYPDATNGDIGYRKGPNFDLDKGDVANLIFHDKIEGNDINTFLNLIDNRININGIVNTVNKNGGFTNGHAVFISPNGMVVGSSGVLNVGALTVLTPDSDTYERYKSDIRIPSLLRKYENYLGKGNGTVQIDGKVLARDFVNINAANVDIANNALVMTGVKNEDKILSNRQAELLFNQLVNTDNMNANAFTNEKGSVKILSYGANGGTRISGLIKNFGAGDIAVTNEGSQGINVSGITKNANGNTLLINTNGGINVSGNMTNQNGKLSLDNTGTGILLASAANLSNSKGDIIITNTGANGINIDNGAKVLDTTDVTYITNTGANGINIKGNVTSNGIKIDNKNSNVTIGDSTGKDYLTSTKNVDIVVNNGNVYNWGTKANLIKANGDLNIDVTNGAIGKEVGPCENGICTGIGEDARDLTKSINFGADGNVTAKSTQGSNKSLINMASLNKDMHVNQIKADGRVILLADDGANKGSKAYNIVNRANDNNKIANVEGSGISIIASGNIGENGNALTFRQNGVDNVFYGDDATKPHVLTPNNKHSQGVDMLAIGNIDVKGLDGENGKKQDTNVCALISRTGSINAEFSGDTYIDETTAAKNIDITTRGKNLYINNLGQAPQTYGKNNTKNDYYGPNNSIVPEKVKLTALDLGSKLIPSEAPEYEHAADSTIVVKNGTIKGKGEGRPAHEQDLTLVADNAYAGGYYFNMGKHRPDGKSTVVEDPTTNPLNNPNGGTPSIRGKAVRPEDVDAIKEDPEDRNYYYGGSSQGNDPNYDGVNGSNDPDKQGTEDDDDNLVVPQPDEPDEPDIGDTDNDDDTDTDNDTDTDLDTDTDIDTDSDIDTDTDTDNDNDGDSDTDTDVDTDTDLDTDTDMDEPDEPDIGDTDSDNDTDNDNDSDNDTDTDLDTDTDIDTDSDIDTDTDTDNDIDGDSDSDIDTDVDTDTDLDTDTDDDPTPPGPDVPPGPDEPNPPVNPDKPDDNKNDDIGFKDVYKQRVLDNPIYGIDKRQHMRFSANESETPINLADNGQISQILDISRGGMAVAHNHNLKVGDVVPVKIQYGNLNINTDVKIVSATDNRAGTEFINLDQATANKILYMNIMLKEQTAARHNNNLSSI